MEKKSIGIEVQVDTEQSIKKVKELAELLEKANSLMDELADKMQHLEINIKR